MILCKSIFVSLPLGLTRTEAGLRQRGMPFEDKTIVQIHAAIAETQRLIMDEFGRLRDSAQNEVSSGENRISQLECQSKLTSAELKQTKAKELHAAELDREAASVRMPYEAFENEGPVKTGPELEAAIASPFLGTLPYVNPRSLAKIQKLPHRVDPLFTSAITHPTSVYAETIRHCKASFTLFADGPAHSVIGIVSSVKGEGKSTFATNFAFHLASNGYRTLLVDADARNPQLSATFQKADSKGLVQILIGEIEVYDACKFEAENLAFLPAGVREAVTNSDELLMSPAFARLLAQARGEFKYVIVDLPPMAPVVDTRIASRHLDGLFYVARWNTTRVNLIRRSLKKSHLTNDKLIGGVINCVPPNEAERPYSYRPYQIYQNS